MPPCDRVRHRDAYRLDCGDGPRYIVYHTSALGDPQGHVPDKWYLLAYPASPRVADGLPFESADEAECAACEATSLSAGPPA